MADKSSFNQAQLMRQRERANRSRGFIASFFKVSNPSISKYVRSGSAEAVPGWVWLAGGAILTCVVALIGFFIATEPIPVINPDADPSLDGVNGADRFET